MLKIMYHYQYVVTNINLISKLIFLWAFYYKGWRLYMHGISATISTFQLYSWKKVSIPKRYTNDRVRIPTSFDSLDFRPHILNIIPPQNIKMRIAVMTWKKYPVQLLNITGYLTIWNVTYLQTSFDALCTLGFIQSIQFGWNGWVQTLDACVWLLSACLVPTYQTPLSLRIPVKVAPGMDGSYSDVNSSYVAFLILCCLLEVDDVRTNIFPASFSLVRSERWCLEETGMRYRTP